MLDPSDSVFHLGDYPHSQYYGVVMKNSGSPSTEKHDVADTVADLLDVYVELRIEGERFLDTFRRVGLEHFKARVYDDKRVENKVGARATA